MTLIQTALSKLEIELNINGDSQKEIIGEEGYCEDIFSKEIRFDSEIGPISANIFGYYSPKFARAIFTISTESGIEKLIQDFCEQRNPVEDVKKHITKKDCLTFAMNGGNNKEDHLIYLQNNFIYGKIYTINGEYIEEIKNESEKIVSIPSLNPGKKKNKDRGIYFLLEDKEINSKEDLIHSRHIKIEQIYKHQKIEERLSTSDIEERVNEAMDIINNTKTINGKSVSNYKYRPKRMLVSSDLKVTDLGMAVFFKSKRIFEDSESEDLYAVKIFTNCPIDANGAPVRNYAEEQIDILKACEDCEHIVNIVNEGEIHTNDGNSYRFIETECGEALGHNIKQLNKKEIVKITQDITKGIKELFEQKYTIQKYSKSRNSDTKRKKTGTVHRDIKPSNVILFKENSKEEDNKSRYLAKITDFNLAKATGSSGDASLMTTTNLPAAENTNLAPEVFLKVNSKKYKNKQEEELYEDILEQRVAEMNDEDIDDTFEKLKGEVCPEEGIEDVIFGQYTDIYGIGVTLYQMLRGHDSNIEGFETAGDKLDIAGKIKISEERADSLGLFPEETDFFIDLITTCMQPLPNKRYDGKIDNLLTKLETYWTDVYKEESEGDIIKTDAENLTENLKEICTSETYTPNKLFKLEGEIKKLVGSYSSSIRWAENEEIKIAYEEFKDSFIEAVDHTFKKSKEEENQIITLESRTASKTYIRTKIEDHDKMYKLLDLVE